ESAALERKRKPLARLNIHAVFWILASIAVTYYFDFLKNIKETMEGNSWWFATGSCLLAASLAVTIYCTLYLECYCGIEDYHVHYPELVPIATATFLAASV
ncbi:TM128 protein, partial [Anhinga anhinga]|nr:TM128 protein [Anhinga anhinga]